MDNYAMESFINWCDKISVKPKESDTGSNFEHINTKFFGSDITVTICNVKNLPGDKMNIMKNVIKEACSNTKIYDTIFKKHSKLIKEINSDPYFNGRKLLSGKDIIKAIKEHDWLDAVYHVDTDCYYIAGEVWFEPDDGFSISFPKGKFSENKSALGTWTFAMH